MTNVSSVAKILKETVMSTECANWCLSPTTSGYMSLTLQIGVIAIELGATPIQLCGLMKKNMVLWVSLFTNLNDVIKFGEKNPEFLIINV